MAILNNTLVRSCGLAAALLLGLTACSSPRQATVDYDRTVNFQQYQTYGFYQPTAAEQAANEQSNPAEPPTEQLKAAEAEAKAYTTLLDQHFKAAINTEMAALGYQYSEQNPQLLVNYMTNVETRTDVRSSPFSVNAGYGHFGRNSSVMFGIPLFGNRLEKDDYKVGTVTIDLIDASAQRVIWQGLVEGRLTKKAMANPQQAINDTVQLIYQSYPTRLNAKSQ